MYGTKHLQFHSHVQSRFAFEPLSHGFLRPLVQHSVKRLNRRGLFFFACLPTG